MCKKADARSKAVHPRAGAQLPMPEQAASPMWPTRWQASQHGRLKAPIASTTGIETKPDKGSERHVISTLAISTRKHQQTHAI